MKLELVKLPTDNLPISKEQKQPMYALIKHRADKSPDLRAVFYGRKGKELADFLLSSWVEDA